LSAQQNNVAVDQSTRSSSPDQTRPGTSAGNSTIVGNDSTSAFTPDEKALSGAYEKKEASSEQNVVVKTLRPGEPDTGFGPVPVTTKDILENAAVIVVPAILLTFEQGIRTAQAFYTHKAGQEIPWVSEYLNLTPCHRLN
jgi:hypothetical protein